MKKKYFIITFVSVVLIVSGILVYLSSKEEELDATSDTGSEITTVNQTSDEITQVFDSEDFNVKHYENTFLNGDKTLIIKEADYPVLTCENAEIINADIEQTATGLCKISENDKTEAGDEYEYAVKSGEEFVPIYKNTKTSVHQTENAVSVLFISTKIGYGASDERTLCPKVYTFENGKSVNLAEYLSKEAESVTETIKDAFLDKIKNNPDDFYPSANEDLEYALSLYNYYLNEDGIVIFCKSGDIAPEAFGEIEITLPYDFMK